MFDSDTLTWAGKKIVLLQLFATCTWSIAQPGWLTLVGNPGEPQNDLVQVNPVSRSGSADTPTLNLRINRANLRTSWDNVPYRSYTATVEIDCIEKTARYTEISFYMMPLWEGKPHKTTSFSWNEMRPLRFRDIEPNPTSRLIRAACPTPLR